ncbi:hypothetical protein [Kribbella capetownensis]|uniref:hypothetical protein n=1 Tax=Kribbella capetownensis TaxID=1572659 RepID=UPI001EDF5467|nr:hypothetical protein [Kribbella capetownensis]
MVIGREGRLRGLALVHGLVGLGSCLCLIVYFTAGGPFGAINDAGNGLFAVLSAVLAWFWQYSDARTQGVLVGTATLGAAIAVVGSILILTDATGWFLSGLVSSAGFAVIGIWLVAVNRGAADDPLSRRLRRSGLIAGVVMLLGFVSAPGIFMGLDDADTAPAWTYLGGFGWAGTYLLFPVWSLRLSRAD